MSLWIWRICPAWKTRIPRLLNSWVNLNDWHSLRREYGTRSKWSQDILQWLRSLLILVINIQVRSSKQLDLSRQLQLYCWSFNSFWSWIEVACFAHYKGEPLLPKWFHWVFPNCKVVFKSGKDGGEERAPARTSVRPTWFHLDFGHYPTFFLYTLGMWNM